MKIGVLIRAEKQLENYVNKHGLDYNSGLSYVRNVTGGNAFLEWEQETENGNNIEISMTIESNEIVKIEEKRTVMMNLKI